MMIIDVAILTCCLSNMKPKIEQNQKATLSDNKGRESTGLPAKSIVWWCPLSDIVVCVWCAVCVTANIGGARSLSGRTSMGVNTRCQVSKALDDKHSCRLSPIVPSWRTHITHRLWQSNTMQWRLSECTINYQRSKNIKSTMACTFYVSLTYRYYMLLLWWRCIGLRLIFLINYIISGRALGVVVTFKQEREKRINQ